MVTVELSKRDAVALRDVLESALTDLKVEGVRTDKEEFLIELGQREKLVGDIIDVLENSEEEV